MLEQETIIDSKEIGNLGILHLKRYWHKILLKKQGVLKQNALQNEWNVDITLLSVLGLGLEQTIRHLYNANLDFDGFEQWVLEVNNGKLNDEKIVQFNQYIENMHLDFAVNDATQNIFTDADMNFWNENGYVIIKNAVPKEDCENTIDAICDFIEIDRYDNSTWYNPHPARQGIMIQLFQHPAIEKNRNSLKIRRAYEQLWQRKDIWVNADRVGFNPPETDSWKFPGPKMHWDVSLKLPIPFGLQGILYLTDTAANQGAFSLVPGFHNKIENWLQNLPPNTNARNENIYELGVIPIVANAGDFIIWHHALPHGSSINTSTQPRFVQYINFEPLDAIKLDEWI